MEQFPKEIDLKDGTTMSVSPLSKRDGRALLAFFTALPKHDRIFLEEDVTRKEVIDRWIRELDHDKVFTIIAEKDSLIHGYATLHFNSHGWQRHVAEMRCVISRKYQHKGLGTALMRELLSFADQKGITKISAQVMDIQASAQRALHKLGFKKAAELKDFATDIRGKTHNLVVMVNNVPELWEKMKDLLFYSDVRTMH